MDAKDVKIGNKYVPHSKETPDGVATSFSEWEAKTSDCCVQFFKINGFLKSTRKTCNTPERFTLSCGECGGWEFNASDFEPATIDVGDTVRLHCRCHDGLEGVVVADDETELTPSQLVIKLPDGRAIGVNESSKPELVRKAKPAQKEQKEEAMFKVGDRVENHDEDYGEGAVVAINATGWNGQYPIRVKHDGGDVVQYTKDGRRLLGDSVVLCKVADSNAPSMTRVVLVRHELPNGTPYLFSVPNGVTLVRDQKVVCDTLHGKVDGWIFSDVIEATPEMLKFLDGLISPYRISPLRRILGVYREQVVRFDA